MHLSIITTLLNTTPLLPLTQSYKLNLGTIRVKYNINIVDSEVHVIWIDGEDPCLYYVNMGAIRVGAKQYNEEPWDHLDGWFWLYNGNDADRYRLVFDPQDGGLRLLNTDGSLRSRAVVSEWEAKLECDGTEWLFVRQEVQFE